MGPPPPPQRQPRNRHLQKGPKMESEHAFGVGEAKDTAPDGAPSTGSCWALIYTDTIFTSRTGDSSGSGGVLVQYWIHKYRYICVDLVYGWCIYIKLWEVRFVHTDLMSTNRTGRVPINVRSVNRRLVEEYWYKIQYTRTSGYLKSSVWILNLEMWKVIYYNIHVLKCRPVQKIRPVPDRTGMPVQNLRHLQKKQQNSRMILVRSDFYDWFWISLPSANFFVK